MELITRVRSNLPSTPSLVHGIPALPIAELLVDIAEIVSPRELKSIVSAASQRKHLSDRVVANVLDLARGRKGARLLRHELRYWDPEMRKALSVLETMFIEMCKERGLDVPEVNRTICGLMVDFVWRTQRVVVEVDGFTFHGDRVAFERDHDRAAILLRGGYLRLAFTWRQILESPGEVVATVLAALSGWALDR